MKYVYAFYYINTIYVINTGYHNVPSAIWQNILQISHTFRLTDSKIRQTSKIFLNTARGYCAITSLSFAHRNIQRTRCT